MLASASRAHADDTMEVGLFGGGLLSNDHSQFYQYGKFPDANRPPLQVLSPELGLRFAYFFLPNFGVEAEGSMVIATTQGMDAAGTGTDQSAKIYSGHVQAIYQYPLPDLKLVPFAAIGAGVWQTSSDYLGSDTDWPLHIGVGARFFVADQVAVRADFRYLRGPSIDDPYTLNDGYGELMIGVQWVPGASGGGGSEGPPPPPPVDRDSDGDGIPDSLDKCPNEPEDKDMFQDDDGCPDPDNDGDGIPDAQDKCPNEPEDKDGFQDLDGCPDPDNDGDGIPDAIDKCPNEPETINGNQDDDGCPDRGDPLVIMSPDRLDLLDAITFKGTTIQKQSLNVLGQIGATLRAHTEIWRLRLTVHVQPTKDSDKDMELSQKRAQVLKDWLVQYGIDAKRLEPRGFGGTKPLVPPDTKGSAAINERVELIILERK
ncbi:MAG: outer membrane beta-barrel protein [Deltaproteobacteria bacterium]|nr:outer membrane beta-barrel protein [Deltaproteobacteria bacterium]